MLEVRKITKEEALKMYDTKWWETMSLANAAKVQLYVDLLIMPFAKFHEGAEALLGRPVWTHEFALADELRAEVETGEGTSSYSKAARLFNMGDTV